MWVDKTGADDFIGKLIVHSVFPALQPWLHMLWLTDFQIIPSRTNAEALGMEAFMVMTERALNRVSTKVFLNGARRAGIGTFFFASVMVAALVLPLTT